MTPSTEPRLEQLLADPVIRLMMASDRISEEDLRQLARRSRRTPSCRNGSPGAACAAA